MKLKDIWTLLKKTFSEWSEDKAPRLAAALAYFTVFSIPPLLVIAIGIAGLVFGQEAAQGAIVQQAGSLIGSDSAAALQGMVESARRPATGIAASAIGVALLLFGASGVFAQLQDAMNTMWEVQPKPGQGLLATLRKRIFSFSMVLVVGFLLLVSLVVTAALGALGDYLIRLFPGFEAVLQVINFLVSLAVITGLFALLFKFVPDAEIAWRDVWLGALVTALLFTLGKMAIGIYLGNSDVASTFGAAASTIIILIWVYYSAQILFFGAEFTQVYANAYGSRIVPEEHAEPVTEEKRAQEGIPRKEGPPQAQPGHPGVVSGQQALVMVPVTAASTQYRALPPPKKITPSWRRILEASTPALLALAVGFLGSLVIVREGEKTRERTHHG